MRHQIDDLTNLFTNYAAVVACDCIFFELSLLLHLSDMGVLCLLPLPLLLEAVIACGWIDAEQHA